MSHIHNIGVNPQASAEYQDYLARLSVNLRAKRRAEIEQEEGVRTFDSAIEADRESDDDRGGQSESDAEGKSGEDAEGEKGWSAKA